MRFHDIICSQDVAEKLRRKHALEPDEVEEALRNDPYVLRGRDGLYVVLGRTDAGRYVTAIIAGLGASSGRLVTARDMDRTERRTYQRR